MRSRAANPRDRDLLTSPTCRLCRAARFVEVASPFFPDSERKSHTGRICALNAVSSSPLTHARNLPTESNSTSCHPSIAMSHPAPSKPGDLFPGEGLERSEAVATVSRHSPTRTDGKLGATAEPPLEFGVPCPGAYLELLRVHNPAPPPMISSSNPPSPAGRIVPLMQSGGCYHIRLN